MMGVVERCFPTPIERDHRGGGKLMVEQDDIEVDRRTRGKGTLKLLSRRENGGWCLDMGRILNATRDDFGGVVGGFCGP
jgi:hypothetical protein